MAENPTGPIVKWTNWSGRFSGPVATLWEPDTYADLVNVVRNVIQRAYAPRRR